MEVYECLISPSLVQQYPFKDLPDADLYDIQDVAVSRIFVENCQFPVKVNFVLAASQRQSLSLEP